MGINYFNRDDRDLKFVLFEYLEIDNSLLMRPTKTFPLKISA